MMPEYAKQVASPLANIDKITVVDTGGGEGGGANKVTGYATNLMATLQESLKASSGIDMKELLKTILVNIQYVQVSNDWLIMFNRKQTHQLQQLQNS